MNFGSVHIDLGAVAQIILALATLVTALKGAEKLKEKTHARNNETDTFRPIRPDPDDQHKNVPGGDETPKGTS